MQILRPLSTGELFDQLFTLYRRHFLLFFFIALVPELVQTLITDSALLGTTGKDSVQAIFIVLLGRIIGFCLTAVSQGATVYAVSQLYLDQPVSGISAYIYVRPLWLSLIVVQIGYSIYVGFGTLLLIIPGIYFAMVYALATNVTAIERLAFREAMDRSKFLMEGNWWRVVLVFVLSLVVSIILAFSLELGAEFGAPLLGKLLPKADTILEQIADVVAVGMATPIALIGLTLIYYDARVRKEAFDLHHVIDTELLATNAVEAGNS